MVKILMIETQVFWLYRNKVRVSQRAQSVCGFSRSHPLVDTAPATPPQNRPTDSTGAHAHASAHAWEHAPRGMCAHEGCRAIAGAGAKARPAEATEEGLCPATPSIARPIEPNQAGEICARRQHWSTNYAPKIPPPLVPPPVTWKGCHCSNVDEGKRGRGEYIGVEGRGGSSS